jgi:hypothetical protein
MIRQIKIICKIFLFIVRGEFFNSEFGIRNAEFGIKDFNFKCKIILLIFVIYGSLFKTIRQIIKNTMLKNNSEFRIPNSELKTIF